MIAEIARVILCLAFGEVLSRFIPIALPAPIAGLMLLFAWLRCHGTVSPSLGTLADQMLSLFGLFFVPAGVGIVAYGEALQADCLAITLAITVGTLVTIMASASAAGAAGILASRRTLRAACHPLTQHGAAPWRDSKQAVPSRN